MENNLTIWCTYHDDSLLQKYNLQELKSYHKLFATHKDYELENLNYLSPVINEAATIYYVWKNQIKSEYVGFEHYCRQFSRIADLDHDMCQVSSIELFNYRKNYLLYHHVEDYDLVTDIVRDIYSNTSKYYNYLLNNFAQRFIPCEMFIMSWDNFNKLCNFIFSIYFEFDKRIRCNLNLNKYIERYHNNLFDMRAFYIERLISCFICCEFDSNHTTCININDYTIQ